jgi:hypothetical protein
LDKQLEITGDRGVLIEDTSCFIKMILATALDRRNILEVGWGIEHPSDPLANLRTL